LLLLALALGAGPGCAAMTNPVAVGVPARRVPSELLARSQSADQTIPLDLLRQLPPAEYVLGPGDVLAVWVEEYLGQPNQPLPIHTGPLVQTRDQRRVTPSTGYPVPVQADGTIDLPGAGTVSVQGLTLTQARAAVRGLYVPRLIKPERARIIVNLLQPRFYPVLVLRQEGNSFTTGPDGLISGAKRGTGYEIDLLAYENDVLHALARTGGLPGLDALNEVVIYRGCFRDPAGRAALLGALGGKPADRDPLRQMAAGLAAGVVRIPLRVPPGQVPCVRPEDILLGAGDVVFVEARDEEIFYTAGLLPPAAHVLPRDRDLDVLEAIALTRGPLVNGLFGVSNLSGDQIRAGLGNPSATLLTVVRRTPGGGQVPIIVDLEVALHNPAERILVRPGDLLILQEKPEQAMVRYLSQTFFNFNIFWEAFHSKFGAGVIDVAAPDRLSGRLGTLNLVQ
jgi:hypothetical protein